MGKAGPGPKLPVAVVAGKGFPADDFPGDRIIQKRTLRGVMKALSNSDFRPAPQQVVVDASKLHDSGIVRLGRIDALDRGVEIE